MARMASPRSLDTETAAIGPRTSRCPRPADVRSGSHRAYTGSPVALRTPSMSCRRSREHRPRAQPGHGPASSVSRRSWPTCSGLRSSPNAASDNRSWRPIVIASSCCIAGAARWPSRNVTSGRSARIESPVRPVAYEPTGPWHRVSGNGRTTSAATRIIVVRHHARSALVRASDRSLRQMQRTPRCAVVASAAFACWLTTSMSMTVRILGVRHRG